MPRQHQSSLATAAVVTATLMQGRHRELAPGTRRGAHSPAEAHFCRGLLPPAQGQATVGPLNI